MRNIKIGGICLAGLFVVGALAASSAFALESVWLEGGVKPTEALLVESEGELSLEDKTEKTDLLCSSLGEGFIATGGNAKLDEVTRILNLELTSSTILCTFFSKEAGSCEESSLPKATMFGLPWLTELVLVGSTVFDLITSPSTGKVGWDSTCLVLGITVLDECTFGTFEAEVANGTEGNALVIFSETLQPFAECTIPKEKVGFWVGVVLVKAASGESLAVSEG